MPSRLSSYRSVFAAAALYALAFVVTTLLHEEAHALAGLAIGRHPVLHHNWVDYVPPDATPLQKLVSASAGPLFSLLQGLLLIPLVQRTAKARAETQLFLMWLCFHGLTNFGGYLFSTPFAPTADLGTIARILGLGSLAQIGLCGLGFLALRASAKVLLVPLLERAPEGIDLADVAVRNRYLVQAAVWPWLFGVILALPFAFPVPHWLSLFYVCIAGAATTFVTEFSKKLSHPPARTGPFLAQIPVGALAALIVLLLVNVFVLVPGVAFGSAL
jgi:hypothetical protein